MQTWWPKYLKALIIVLMIGGLWLEGLAMAHGHEAAVGSTIHWFSAALGLVTLVATIRALTTSTPRLLRAAAFFCVALSSAVTFYTTAHEHTQSTIGWVSTMAILASLYFIRLDRKANEPAR